MSNRIFKLFVVYLAFLSEFKETKGENTKARIDVSKDKESLSAAKSILYGPALNPGIVTPARYLYIQAVYENGRNYTKSAGANVFIAKVYIEHDGGRSQLRNEIRDRGDGTYQIFIYYGIQPHALILSVQTADGQYVGGSGPRIVKDVEVEQCYCPKIAQTWTSNYECPQREVQLDHDLSIFPRIDRALLNKTFSTLLYKEACVVHYIIRRNRIYGKAYGRY